MKGRRWVVLPAAGLAAIIIGIVAVEAAPSPSPSTSGSKNYAQVFVDKLAAILHLNSTQTRDALKQAELLQRGQIPHSHHLIDSAGEQSLAVRRKYQTVQFG